MRPLPFVWPYALVFWGVYVWAFLPEWKVVRGGVEGTKSADSKDSGSLRVAAWRNVDRALSGISTFVHPDMVFCAKCAATAVCGRRSLDTSRQLAATLLLAHARSVFHWRREGEIRSAGDSHRSVPSGAASVVYGGHDDVHRNRPRAGKLVQFHASHDCNDRDLRLSRSDRGASTARHHRRAVPLLYEGKKAVHSLHRVVGVGKADADLSAAATVSPALANVPAAGGLQPNGRCCT